MEIAVQRLKTAISTQLARVGGVPPRSTRSAHQERPDIETECDLDQHSITVVVY